MDSKIVHPFSLAGKKALITGGGTGLGLAMAMAFIQSGARVIISGRREDVLKEAVSTLGENAAYVVCDLSDLESIPEFVEKVYSQFGVPDILVNNAGIHLKKDLLDVSNAEYEKVIQTNQTSVFVLTREISKGMLKQGRGSVIMISSMASRYGIPKVIAYSAAKSAIEGMTRAMATELSPGGVRINCIAPGFIRTEMSDKALNNDPQRKQKVLGRTPAQRLGEPEEVANAAVFLASDAASFITGVVLPVDGGNSIGF
ncbi:MAG: SDR family oxidoreductase [Cyclobacteriaceae bacterium]|nr:SDR family oxidoreductase [Cyclobacteriaceae bacterium]